VAVAVSGTTTTGVVMDTRGGLLARSDLDTEGDLAAALTAVFRQLVTGPGIHVALVTHVMLGVGSALARALEDRAVGRVAVIRIGSPLTRAVPPLAAWPRELREAVSAGEIVVSGGAEYTGRSDVALDEDRIARFLGTLDDDVEGVAITGVFSPVAPDQELAAAALVRRERGPRMHLSLSHELDTLGLIERENAAVLNAALAGASHRLAARLQDALRAAGIGAEAFLSQTDGTLMALQSAKHLPILMLDSGPANAMRGAVHLTGVDDAVVVHCGGTATEVGTVIHGLPRDTVAPAEVAGVRLGFRVPDVWSLRPDADGAALAEAVDRARADLQDPPLVAIGRGNRVVPDGLPGIGRVLRPEHGDVAAAVGAAIAEVTGRAHRISADRPDRRREAVESAREAAIARAVHAGADPDGLQVVGVVETPLTRDVEPVLRIGVKVAGPPA
jgi:N-methylhydantoinase A/oxoprolinase/acetone carboxylase beta subunit